MRPLVSPSLRVSAAEREHLARRLRDACVEDRLSLDTFIRRLDLLYAARTAGELRALIADLPKPRPFGRQLARLSGWAAECVTIWADAWGRITAQRLMLPTGQCCARAFPRLRLRSRRPHRFAPPCTTNTHREWLEAPRPRIQQRHVPQRGTAHGDSLRASW
jgi:hypothetical protein